MRRGPSCSNACRLAALGVAALSLFAATTSNAEEFSAERVELVVPFTEGGGTDLYARYFARVLGPALPGAPGIAVVNMPGGGSIVGANNFEARGDEDGSSILAVSTATHTAFTFRDESGKVRYDPSKWIAIIGSPLGAVNVIRADTGVATIADLATLGEKEVVLGIQGATGSSLLTLLSFELLGLNVRPVFGVDGGAASISLERGEVQIHTYYASNYASAGQPLVDSGVAVPLFSFGYLDEAGKVARDPNFPDVPSFVEAYEQVHGKAPSGPEFDAWMALFQAVVMNSKALVLPATAAPEVVQAYREAMAQVVEDPGFAEEAAPFIGGYPQSLGEAAQDSLESGSDFSPEVQTWIRNWLQQYGATLSPT